MAGTRAWIGRLTGAAAEMPGEARAAVLAFATFFCLLAGYYVLRPIRDEMAIQAGTQALPVLFTAVFVVMALLVPVWGALTARVPRRVLLPWVYAFFVVNLLGFQLAMTASGTQAPWVARVFFVWLSVFNLFAVAMFWSLMADLFSRAQAERLYGFVAAGGTLGALTGPALTASLVHALGPRGLMPVSAVFLGGAILAIAGLRRWARGAPSPVGAPVAGAQRPGGDPGTRDDGEQAGLGGSVWGGVIEIARSPLLLAICLFLLGYSLLSTFLYFQQVALVPAAIPDPADRTRLLALVDLATNLLTLAVQVGAFGWLIRRLGPTALLVAMPAVAVVGFAWLAVHPAIAVLVAFGVVRRAGEYAISKPARETLFNALTPEEKYKAKNVIDTLVHRTGDTLSSWAFTGLRAAGLSPAQIAAVAVPVALAWAGVAWWLGRTAARLPAAGGVARAGAAVRRGAA